MKVKNYLLLSLVALLAVTACKKSSTPKPGTPNIKIDTDVYILGEIQAGTNDVAAYWKNGVLIKLSDTTKNCYAEGNIIINGPDVYATGYYYDGIQGVPVCWKNGKEIRLSIPTDSVITDAYTKNITVNNNSVYVVGGIYGAHGYHNVYWQDNGMPVQFSDKSFNAYAVAVNGTEVDFAGFAHSDLASGNTSAYYKGNIIQLSTDNLRGGANAMVLDGTDIYTAGNTYYTSTHIYKATYWKNGIPTYLTNGSSSEDIDAIALKDQAVYTAGYTTAANGKSVATYWKNGTVGAILGDGQTSSNATGIAPVGNNDIYLSGYIGNTAVYWENGVKKTLPRGTYTTGIAIITHPHQ